MSQERLTPFERHLKKVEEKNQREKAEAAELYQEFVRAFAAEDEPEQETLQETQSTWNQDLNSGPKKASEGTLLSPMGLLENKYRKSVKKKRNIDTFLEEIKKGKTATPQSVPQSAPKTFLNPVGSHDSGDPLTTNIFLGNLNPSTTEETLLRTFGRFGPVGSIKIMYPRTPEEHLRGYNSGFVSFMERDDAEAALEALQGTLLDGFLVRLAWGKPVKRPLKPLSPPSGFVYGGSSLKTTALDTAGEHAKENNVVIDVVPPFDLQRRREIDLLALHVSKEGYAFESLVIEREKKLSSQGRSRFRFLFDVNESLSEESIYYRWKVYSLCQGDMESRWRTIPFVMYENGPSWRPPTCSKPYNNPGMKKNELEVLTENFREQEGEDIISKVSRKDASLKQGDVDQLMKLLQNISPERSCIAEAMVFCVERAFAAGDIASIIAESLMLDETPIAIKTARLYLISDILHNSVAPVHNASAFRSRFQMVLPQIFDSIGKSYEKIQGFIASSSVRAQIEAVLEAWSTWSLYPEEFIEHLRSCYRRSYLKSESIQGEASTSIQGQSPVSVTSKQEEEMKTSVTVARDEKDWIEEEDLDGVPLEEDEEAIEIEIK
ncbi:U2-associated protein SR14 isoform 2 [Galdieria sulphuraria]|uniref:U2-associated protein SR14 isoform 2 n=1 Tax=Galdieria sulphuraria TaxID=130081 RepID=M2XY82_GALSU|nr:U2-associated protein SR14 isoform 2 [Galdieria sulphuraria]EME28613.1 U2-associated protein SR14 isoform 2 [Galdieria sulphuraria]|eukprot:XP_005705133.1 U2-associated protein SR14 isoform 2 [Galdieria sulphuraria]